MLKIKKENQKRCAEKRKNEPDIRNVNSQMSPIQCNHGDQNINTNVQSDSGENDNINQLNMNTPCLQKLNNDNIKIMDMNGVDEDSNVIHRDTLLHEEDIPHVDPKSFPHELIFAPGEGHRPRSIFQDADVENLAFPTIFCGQRQRENGYKVNCSDVCKYKLQSVDRRVATNVPNVFFKFKKVQMKSVIAKMLMCRYKRKGKDICAHDVLDDDERAKIVRLNEGYYIFKIYVIPLPTLQRRKKRHLQWMPALFISQSAAETKWPKLLRALGQTVDNKTY